MPFVVVRGDDRGMGALDRGWRSLKGSDSYRLNVRHPIEVYSPNFIGKFA